MRSGWHSRSLLIAASALLLPTAACLPILRRTKPEIMQGQAGFENTVQVRFLGVGGFMVRLGRDAFMTAPLYSNPQLPKIIANEEIPPDLDRIRDFHHPTSNPGDIKALLVGHAHYDHLMDVVPVWRQLVPTTPIYGSLTMRRILAGHQNGPVQQNAVIALNDPSSQTGDVVDCQSCGEPAPCPDCSSAEECSFHPQVQGSWVAVPNSRIRILALCSAHPPQFAHIVHKWPGCVRTDRTTPPRVPKDYLEGEVFAYLIDFLDQPGGSPVFRVYYQDAASDGVKGWAMIPQNFLNERDVDLALLCAGNWDAVRNPEEVLVRARVKNIVLGHWENFFVPQSTSLTPIPHLEGSEYIKRLKQKTGVMPLLPAPQVMMRFPL